MIFTLWKKQTCEGWEFVKSGNVDTAELRFSAQGAVLRFHGLPPPRGGPTLYWPELSCADVAVTQCVHLLQKRFCT